VPNFVSFAAAIAQLALGEKSRTQSLTHPAYFMPREPKRLRFGKKVQNAATHDLKAV